MIKSTEGYIKFVIFLMFAILLTTLIQQQPASAGVGEQWISDWISFKPYECIAVPHPLGEMPNILYVWKAPELTDRYTGIKEIIDPSTIRGYVAEDRIRICNYINEPRILQFVLIP